MKGNLDNVALVPRSVEPPRTRPLDTRSKTGRNVVHEATRAPVQAWRACQSQAPGACAAVSGDIPTNPTPRRLPFLCTTWILNAAFNGLSFRSGFMSGLNMFRKGETASKMPVDLASLKLHIVKET